MQYETIRIEKEGAVDWLTLDRPDRLNTINPRTIVGRPGNFVGR